MENSISNLVTSLQRVIEFFSIIPNWKDWTDILIKIKLGIIDGDTREEALKLLSTYFGGMGTLNDLVFCEGNRNIPDGYTEHEANKEFEVLLHKLYKDFKCCYK